MLRVTYSEETSTKGVEYHQDLCLYHETPFQLLMKHNANPETANVYINGRFIAGEKLRKPFGELIGPLERIFLTVKSKG